MHQRIVSRTDIIIQILTCSALVGLLGAVGLRLTWQEVKAALLRCDAIAIVGINFLVVPTFVVAAAKIFHLERDTTVGMLLLAAARGTELGIAADGPDEAEAVAALADLVARGFEDP